MLTFLASYDQESLIKKEQIGLNEHGQITNTSICHFDNMRHMIYFYGGRNSHFYHYCDNSGNEIVWKVISPKHSRQNVYKSEYDDEKTIHRSGSGMNAVFSGNNEIKYNYI